MLRVKVNLKVTIIIINLCFLIPDSEDSRKLAEILLQRPIDMSASAIHSTRLTEAEINRMQDEAKKHFDVVLDTLKQMPRNMLFIVR